MKKVICSLMFCCSILFANSQNQSIYQKKMISIKIQMLKDMGIKQSTIDKYSSTYENLNKLTESVFADANYVYSLDYKYGKGYFLSLVFKYSLLEKEAEKYMNKDEIRKVNERKEKEIQEQKKQKAIKDAELEEQRKKEIQEKEIEEAKEKERLKLEKYNNSDYNHMKQQITKKFDEWLKKGEFEKTSEYNNRVQFGKHEFFKTIVTEAINNSIKNKLNNETLNNEAYFLMSWKLLNYDADNENFKIAFRYDGGEDKFYWVDSLNVHIKDAESFKARFHRFELTISSNDVGMYNNYWIPKKLILVDENRNTITTFKVQIPINNESNFIFSAQELGFEDSSLIDVKYGYQDYLENLRQDSIKEEERRIQIKIAAEQKRQQDSIIAEKLNKEKEIFEKQERKDNDTLSGLLYQNKVSNNKIIERYYQNEAKQNQVNNTQNNSLIKFAIVSLTSSSSSLSKSKELIYSRYESLRRYYENARNESPYAHRKLQIARIENEIDGQILAISGNKEIKELAKKLEPCTSISEIEKVFGFTTDF